MQQRSKGKSAQLRILIATDGSPSARAALTTTVAFPWPQTSLVRGVVVSPLEWVRSPSRQVRRAFAQAFVGVANTARRTLARRWPNAEVANVEGRTIDGILREAHRFRADVIVVGWRGYGAVRRMLAGSVSRRVVEQARRAVLVVRRPVREVRRIVIGVDGSSNARRAVDLVARLPHERREIVVVRVVEPRTVPTAGRLPAALRSVVLTELAALNERLMRAARREAETMVARLRRAGWKARAEVRSGAPLVGLLDAVERIDAHLLVVGARATSGVRRALLGSVAAGALDRSPVPVLVVR